MFRKRSFVLLACSFMLSAACGSEDPGDGIDPNDPFPPPAQGEGYQIEMSATAPAGTEIYKCVVDRLPNDDWMFVNHVASLQTEGMHHMDVMILGFAGIELEPGTYECADLYAEYPDLMDGLIIYAAQDAEQEITMPEGIAANLPPNLLMMHEIHYVNTSDQPVEAFSRINIYDYDPFLVTDTIWGNVVRDLDLNIPAQASTHQEWTRCVMTDPIDLIFLSSHTHELATSLTVRSFDGNAPGDQIYENRNWESPFLKSFGETAMHIPAGEGFEFTCNFTNPSEDVVTWGLSARDEMCQIAFVFSPGEAKRKCNVVETSDGLGL